MKISTPVQISLLEVCLSHVISRAVIGHFLRVASWADLATVNSKGERSIVRLVE
jgi:hypothetical protein